MWWKGIMYPEQRTSTIQSSAPRNTMKASAAPECLQPAAGTEARDLQNFFPFPRLLEEKEDDLGPEEDDEEEEPLPDADPDHWGVHALCRLPPRKLVWFGFVTDEIPRMRMRPVT